MNYYQIIEFIVQENSYYCIWFSIDDTGEGLLTENGRLRVFRDIKSTEKFAEDHNIILDNVRFCYLADSVEKWTSSPNRRVDCKELLDFWNIAQDVSASNNSIFLGNRRTAAIDGVYDKLFYGVNIFVENKAEKYYPSWKTWEIKLLKKIIGDAASVIKKALGLLK